MTRTSQTALLGYRTSSTSPWSLWTRPPKWESSTSRHAFRLLSPQGGRPLRLIGPVEHVAHCCSPELVAKLGHDFTVYAYDYSEYETPLVGQGMLSWILASASSTPNAPAQDSQTMVTGRVCKNILGIFSNGIKETLEVKLKLVPVPTCMQKEYVENMERYHSLSQMMPGGFDYNVWSDFLKENPTLGHLAQPAPAYPAQPSPRPFDGGVEPFHQMLTRQSPSQEPPRNDSPYDHQSNTTFMSQPTRASSPAMSTYSFHQYNPPSRSGSRASFRSEAASQPQQFPFSDPYMVEQPEEGPPKKRARITQTTRPRNTPLTTHNDSLRVTASTAASVRLLKPALSVSGAAADMVPRAPTPRPGDKFGPRGSRRQPAPSALRHASMDGVRPYVSPYDNSVFSDNAVESADERDGSPGDTPNEMPSSPPIVPQRTASSSPNLPTIPLNDSGFVSDMPMGREDDGMMFGNKMWDGSESQQHHRNSVMQPITQSIEMDMGTAPAFDFDTMSQDFFNSGYFPEQRTNHESDVVSGLTTTQQRTDFSTAKAASIESVPFGASEHNQAQAVFTVAASTAGSPDGTASQVSPPAESEAQVYSRSATPNLPPKQARPSKPRGLPRSHTWSGAAEPMSDAPTPSENGNPRSGSGAQRRRHIKNRLEEAIAKGEMPPHCVNCGEIETPTWRKAFTRVENGSPEGIELSTDSAGTDIIAYEVIEPSPENDGELKYRIFKNKLTHDEKKEAKSTGFEAIYLCNPCGLWLLKKSSMRPRRVWDKAARQANRQAQKKIGTRSKSMNIGEELASDAAMPESDAAPIGEQDLGTASLDGAHEEAMPPPTGPAGGCGPNSDATQAAFRRAIQSSPAGVRGSRKSPIDLDQDLTPKPTRRLLFPSPRNQGENKSLTEHAPHPAAVSAVAAITNTVPDDDAPKKPRCQRCKELKRACDRERPCDRCDRAGIGYDGCVPCQNKQPTWFEQPVVQVATVDQENPDKENCPPPPATEQDDLAHLFEDPASPKTTPKKDQIAQDLLKTPTPGTCKRTALTPRRGDGNGDVLTTPFRNILTARGDRAATSAPDTPFTRQLNALLSDCPISSPSQAIDFSAFPTFTTPGRTGVQFSDYLPNDFLSSDMPVTSSPDKNGSLGLGFDLYEDPNTSTMGLWSGENIFGNETMVLDMNDGSKRTSLDVNDGPDAAALLKMNVGGMTVDFAAMIEEVVSAANKHTNAHESTAEPMDEDVKPAATSPEAESQEAPASE
jgi:hypothetical protein